MRRNPRRQSQLAALCDSSSSSSDESDQENRRYPVRVRKVIQTFSPSTLRLRKRKESQVDKRSRSISACSRYSLRNTSSSIVPKALFEEDSASSSSGSSSSTDLAFEGVICLHKNSDEEYEYKGTRYDGDDVTVPRRTSSASSSAASEHSELEESEESEESTSGVSVSAIGRYRLRSRPATRLTRLRRRVSAPVRRSKRSLRSISHRTYQNESESEASVQASPQRNRKRHKPDDLNWSQLGMLNTDPDDMLLTRGAKQDGALADVTPLEIDTSINWDSIGGLGSHIQSLKEMVVLPLLYPELFTRFKIAPPRGVLFYGPPGTGKTLCARALANTCSQGGQKVSFYMRKGADCLSKWVGEAERQLRLLFEEAQKNQPAIIFFDEIDGLAPVRSSKQDQIHSSIVSTLLALMDGLDNRGQVIIIGATNRPDAIDPALRRPGRFDRELCFALPSSKARRDILGIHTAQWDPAPTPELLQDLAEKTAGYCGADLRSLCSEASLLALRRSFPQIYSTTRKLQLQLSVLRVLPTDFQGALEKIVPSAKRSSAVVAAALPAHLEPLCRSTLNKAIQETASLFPGLPSIAGRPRLLVSGPNQTGQAQIACALLQHLEEYAVHSLDLSVLLGDTFARSAEECCARTIREAIKSAPSVILWPHLELWWETASSPLRALVLTMLQDIPASDAVLVVGYTDTDAELDDDLVAFFAPSKSRRVQCSSFSQDQRFAFFASLGEHVETMCLQERQQEEHVAMEPLPETVDVAAERPSRDETEDNVVLMRMRTRLRALCGRLIKDFPEFRERPYIKSLSSILEAINTKQCLLPRDLLSRIDQLVQATNKRDLSLYNKACQLQDLALAVVFTYPPALVKQCREILDARASEEGTEDEASQDASLNSDTNTVLLAPVEDKSCPHEDTAPESDGVSMTTSAVSPNHTPEETRQVPSPQPHRETPEAALPPLAPCLPPPEPLEPLDRSVLSILADRLAFETEGLGLDELELVLYTHCKAASRLASERLSPTAVARRLLAELE